MEKKNKKKKYEGRFSETPSTVEQNGLPENCSEMVNYFGTYEIQQTQNASNTYPAIGQGISEEEAEKLEKESDRWQRENQ